MKGIYRYLAFTLLLLPVAVQAQKKDSATIVSYINQYKDIAISEMKRSGVPASITLAQGIHESSFGKSYLAVNTNNHFGIKCKETWTGKTFKYTDDAPNECFRVYETVEESYRDHSDFLKFRPRYADLFLLDITDYKGWSYGLKKAGYATNPKYPEILIKTIEDYQLYAFDTGNNPSYIQPAPAPQQSVLQTYEDEEYQVTDSMEVTVPEPQQPEKKTELKSAAVTPSPQPVTTKAVSKKITLINKVKTVKLYKGETPELIANIFSIEPEELLTYNDVSDAAQLKEGQVVYIQQKKKSSKEGTYKVKSEDNLWSIAQKKGIRLASLRKMNKLDEGEEPAPKTVLVLKGKAKEKPALRTAAEKPDQKAPVVKSGVEVSAVVRAKDTIYPELRESLPLVVEKDKVLGWENDTRLKEDKTPVVYESKQPEQKEVQIVKAEIPKQPDVRPHAEEPKTIYPAVIAYDSLPKSTTGWHTVVKGDTMYNICKRYKISVAEFMQWNNLSEQTVKLGQQLKIQP
jgi:LysM repeat protein